MNSKSILWKMFSGLFALSVLAVGFLNLLWGNDPVFGIFLILLSLLYFPPAEDLLKKKIGFGVPLFLKILLGIFIIIAVLGVGELFYKIDLMRSDW